MGEQGIRTIAITGATGFLGRYLVRKLAKEGRMLRCWFRPGSDRGGFEDVDKRLEWVPGELGARASVRTLLSGADAVVHAGLARDTGGFQDVGETGLLDYLRRNLMGSLELLAEAKAAGVPRFVFIASCAVHDVILEDRPLDEAHPLWPKSHYGAHKAAVEKFIHSFGLGAGYNVCSLRPTGIYGIARPTEASKWYGVVADVVAERGISNAAGGKEVHASDVARAVELLLGRDDVAGQAFNCFDIYISAERVARLAKRITGSKSVIEERNRGPKHMIETGKLRALGMEFGGERLLERYVRELVGHITRKG